MSIDIEDSDLKKLGFVWWTFQGWLWLIAGTVGWLGLYKDLGAIAVVLGALNIGLSVMMIRFSRKALIIGTVLTINPFLWIINGIYIKNRRHHPRVLENQSKEDPQDSQIRVPDKSIAGGPAVATVSVSPTVVMPNVFLNQASTQTSSKPEIRIASDDPIRHESQHNA